MTIHRISTDSKIAGALIGDQFELENDAVRAGVAKYRRLQAMVEERGDAAALKPAERLVLHWLEPVTRAVQKEHRQIRAGRAALGRSYYGPYLLQVKPDVIAVAAMHQAIGWCVQHPDGAVMTSVAHAIGRSIIAELNFDLMRKDDRRQRAKLREQGREKDVRQYQSHTIRLDRFMRRMTPGVVNWYAKKSMTDAVYSRKVCAHLGTFMIWTLINECSATSYKDPTAAFVTSHKQGTYRLFHMTEACHKLIAEGHALRELLAPVHRPMIVPPLERSDDGGGYYRNTTPFISGLTPTQRTKLEETDLTEIHECLTAIDQTAWRVNEDVVDAQRDIWDSGGGVLNIPQAEDLPMPERPVDADEVAMEAYKDDARRIHAQNVQLRGQRITFLRQHSVADMMRHRDAVWFPHSLDFRGRTYPIPQYLNHHGSDLSRGCLMFAEGEPLGERGWYWLRVHASNCFGFDKVTFDQRVRWADKRIDRMRHAALTPFADLSWLEDADDPWQFLAACIEIGRAVESGNVHTYRCALPVQMDGTCSAMQHYAAMLRNPVLARLVNMTDDDPQDLYQYVTDMVLPTIEVDDHPCAAEALEWCVRKVTKQPIMTLSYGVTRVGARKQVQTAMVDMGRDKDGSWRLAVYLVEKIMAQVKKVCAPAVQAMRWMRDCALMMTKHKHPIPVQWTTQLGLPVVQPYRNYRNHKIDTVLNSLQLRMNEEDRPLAPGQHSKAIAANFVHSVDSTHLFMTGREMHRRKLPSAYVHDGYWTLPCYVDTLNEVTRDHFVKLHRLPLLDDLHRQWKQMRPDLPFPDPPKLGRFDIEQVRHAKYFFN